MRDVRGGDAAAAIEAALSGLDRGAWPTVPTGPLATALGLSIDELLRCRQVCDALLLLLTYVDLHHPVEMLCPNALVEISTQLPLAAVAVDSH